MHNKVPYHKEFLKEGNKLFKTPWYLVGTIFSWKTGTPCHFMLCLEKKVVSEVLLLCHLLLTYLRYGKPHSKLLDYRAGGMCDSMRGTLHSILLAFLLYVGLPQTTAKGRCWHTFHLVGIPHKCCHFLFMSSLAAVQWTNFHRLGVSHTLGHSNL